MNITPGRQALFLLPLLLLLASVRASAQEEAPARIRLEGPSWSAAASGSFLLRPCPSAREHGLAFCLGGDAAPPSAAAKRFTAFTRLAGMFMGRVIREGLALVGALGTVAAIVRAAGR
ncbi:MAG: hypothetical protein KGJ84_15365 [Elusimicrobia bacterium]|nr:hypothetical protein [Elusimicrobiota bacterium]